MIRIAIASGKGGTGKTLFATNIYDTLMRAHKSAILVDCDAEAPNAAAFFKTRKENSFEVTQMVPVINTEKCTFCGKCHEYCMYNAIMILPPVKIIQVIEDLCHGCGACTYACAPGAITEKPVPLGTVTAYKLEKEYKIIEARMNVGVMSPVPVIKKAISHSGNKDLVILDSPPGTSCPFIQTAAASEYIILVTEPTPFGLSDLKQSCFTLNQMGKPYGVIINRTGLGNREVHDWIKENDITLLMELPYNEAIARFYSEGRLLVEESQHYRDIFTDLSDNINKTIRTLVNEKL